MEWSDAKDVKRDILKIVATLNLSHIDTSRVFCYRTVGSTSRSYARIWAMPKIFQSALDIQPAYVIEVLAKYYDKRSEDEKKNILIHELLHIPRIFPALFSHKGRGRHLNKEADRLFREYKNKAI